MAKFQRLKVPSFDLSSCEQKGTSYILIPGGGGSTKSGVKNQIQVAKVSGGKEPEFKDSYLTDTEDKTNLCSGLCSGSLKVDICTTFLAL